MLGHNGNEHRGVFRALALVDGHRVGWDEHVEFAEPVGHRTAVKAGGEIAGFGVEVLHEAYVTVVDLLVVIVLDLHHLVARREGPAESLDLAFAGRVHGCLQFEIEGASADPAAVHRAENLDVADRSRPKRRGILVLTSSTMRATATSGSSACTK